MITEKEFRAALKHYSFPFKLTKHEMKLLMSYFKRNGESGVSFSEFAAFVCPDTDMDRVERKLRAILSAQDALHTNVTRTFKSLDKMGIGTLPIGPFRQAMRDLGLPVTSNEASILIDHFDPTGKGEINYMEFIKFMRGSKSPRRRRGGGGREKKSKKNNSHYVLIKTDVREALRAAAERFIAAGGDPKEPFESAFREMAKSEDQVDFSGFKKCMKKKILVGQSVPTDELRMLFECFDLNGDGFVSYREFVTFAMATLNSDDLEVLGERIRDELKNQVGDAHSSKRLRKVFRTFDTDNDGHITLKEFQKGLKRLLGAPFDHLKDEELQELIKRFDRREDGTIDYADFVAFVNPEEDVDVVERKIGNMMRMLRKYRNVDVAELFEDYDDGDTGLITLMAFRDVVRKLGLPLRRSEMDSLMLRYSKIRNGEDMVDYITLLDAVIGEDLKNNSSGDDDDDDVCLSACINRFSRKHIFSPQLRKHIFSLQLHKHIIHKKQNKKQSNQQDLDEKWEQRRQNKGDTSKDPNWDRRLYKNMHRAFVYLDRDKSKALDVNELKKCVRALRSDVTDRDVEQFMREADSSGDGKIGFEEFYDIMIAQLELGGGHGLTRENLSQAFVVFDIDNSGQINHNEFEYMLRHHLKIELSPEELRSLIYMLDKDNNGEISFAELVAMIDLARAPAKKLRKTDTCARRALQKLARGPPPDPLSFIKALDGAPTNYRSSALQRLDKKPSFSLQSCLLPERTPKCGLRFRAFDRVGRPLPNREQSWAARVVDQEGSLVWDGMCPNFFHAKIDLNWIKGVPLYSDDHVDQIVSRKLRMVRTNIRAFPYSPFRNTQTSLRSCTPIPITLRDTKRTLEIK